MATRKRPPLSKQRQQYVEQRSSGLQLGKPLHYPAAPAARYRASLDKLAWRMQREYEREINKLWREYGPITQDASLASQARIALNRLRDRFAKLFAKAAPTITERMLGGVDKASAASLGESLKALSGGVTLKTQVMPAALKESMTAATAENVALIKSVATQYHDRVEGAVMRSIQQGGEGRATIAEELQKIGGMTERRVKIIAEDQTRKATTAANALRAKSLGIRKFRWVHSGGGAEPRRSHIEASGNIYSYDDPPRIGDNGEAVLPGQAIGCRCVSVPVLEWGSDPEE
jgi:SPP1 gp7 family putative phage head morphogenesis protein